MKVLPAGWSAHTSPSDRTYYYHEATGKSTYKFPKREKREKPISKSSIAEGWWSVCTNKDRIFYWHPATKQSQWLFPQAIKQQRKRKTEDVVVEEHEETKRPRAEIVEEQEDEEEEDGDDADWQRAMAQEMAAEAAADDGQTDLPQPLPPPVDVEVLKNAFHTALTELNGTPNEVNPMAPWDVELKRFDTLPSYLELPAKEREDTFNQWCKLRIRDKRAAKAKQPVIAPHEAYSKLLTDEVRSTRTQWSDFRNAFKRDPRFVDFSTEQERQKLFETHLVQLGEAKRKAAQQATEAFMDLLSEKLPGNLRSRVAGAETAEDVWLEAKQNVLSDPRYDQVGSSTRRLELFKTWTKGERRVQPSPPKPVPALQMQTTKSKHALAMQEREAKVRAERERVMRDNQRALGQATRQESMVVFQQLLVDSIRDAQLSTEAAVRHIARDPRFDTPGLSYNDRESLLSDHMARLKQQQRSKLDTLFRRHAQSLDAHPDDVIALTLQDADLETPALKHHNKDTLQHEYQRWNRSRLQQAENDFTQMLQESAFVDFWGRLKKEAATDTIATTEDDAEEDSTTLRNMAAKMDLHEIEAILRNDARYKAFSHAPERRQEMIRHHLTSLAAPSRSVYTSTRG